MQENEHSSSFLVRVEDSLPMALTEVLQDARLGYCNCYSDDVTDLASLKLWLEGHADGASMPRAKFTTEGGFTYLEN